MTGGPTYLRSGEIYDILTDYDALAGGLKTIGLLGNMVYDIIPSVNHSDGIVSVNATIISVDCGVIPDLRQNSTDLEKSGNIDYFFVSPDDVLSASGGPFDVQPIRTSG